MKCPTIVYIVHCHIEVFRCCDGNCSVFAMHVSNLTTALSVHKVLNLIWHIITQLQLLPSKPLPQVAEEPVEEPKMDVFYISDFFHFCSSQGIIL